MIGIAGAVIRMCPQLPNSMTWGTSLGVAAEEFGIDTPTQQAMWLSQLLHESMSFTKLTENLNYSAKRLAQVWPRRFAVNPRAVDLGPNALAQRVANKPEAIANIVYADRMGNGPDYTGDGWLFRGRYPVQLTGRYNYTHCQAATGVPDLLDPDLLLEDIPGMARVCGWFWKHYNFAAVAEEGDLTEVVKKWNGGLIGLEDRSRQYQRVMLAMELA